MLFQQDATLKQSSYKTSTIQMHN